MEKIIKGFVLIVLVGFVFLATGCATYSTKGAMPVLGQIEERKLVKVEKEGITVTAFPIVTKEDSEKYFDDNICRKRVLAVHLTIVKNHQDDAVKLISLNLIMPDGELLGYLSAEDVYKVIKRGWFGKSTFWWFFGVYVGAPLSALHTQEVNKKIEEDINEKNLKFNEIKLDAPMSGFVWFQIPKKAMPEPDKGFPQEMLLKLIFEKDGELFSLSLPI